MPYAKRRCTGSPTCPAVLTAGERYCPTHMARYEATRGTSTARGYDSGHRKLRGAWQATIETGGTPPCSRCGYPIQSDDEWALDHDDDDRTKYLGPSHKRCNDSAGGKASHRRKRS